MENPISKEQKKQLTVAQAGRLGGYATLQTQGIEHFQKIGRKGGKKTAKLYRNLLREVCKKGGRPRRPNLMEYMEGENH